MKKWIVFAVMAVMLAGCGSGGTKETSKSEKGTASASSTEQTASAPEVSSSEKKIELKEVDFDVEGTPYKMKVIDSWEIIPDEELSFNAEDEDKVQGLMIYGFKKTDFESLAAFKDLIKNQFVSTEEIEIKEETVSEAAYKTAHYEGYLYNFTGTYEGANVQMNFYFLETESDYALVNLIAFPSFYDKNGDLVTEMLNSFVAE